MKVWYTDMLLETKQENFIYLWRGNRQLPRWHTFKYDGALCKWESG